MMMHIAKSILKDGFVIIKVLLLSDLNDQCINIDINNKRKAVLRS